MGVPAEVSVCDDLVQYAVGLETLRLDLSLLVGSVCFQDEEERAGGHVHEVGGHSTPS